MLSVEFEIDKLTNLGLIVKVHALKSSTSARERARVALGVRGEGVGAGLGKTVELATSLSRAFLSSQRENFSSISLKSSSIKRSTGRHYAITFSSQKKSELLGTYDDHGPKCPVLINYSLDPTRQHGPHRAIRGESR